MGSARDPEVHLFVVWEHGRAFADRIVADVRQTFDVLDAVEVVWTPEAFPRSLSRLYGQSLPPGSDKEVHVGRGPFLLLVVEDRAPDYGTREKWGEQRWVNTRLFDAKLRYREWTGGHRVHGTTDEAETDHDLFLLLGERLEDVRRRPRVPWDGTVRRLVRDLTGTSGWADLAEMLTAVELTLAYVQLPDPGTGRLRLLVEGSWDHWGVQWLVSEPDRRPAGGDPALYPVLVAGEQRELELRSVGDGSADPAWQRALLRDRVRDASGAFVLAPADAFAALLHGALDQGGPRARSAGRSGPPPAPLPLDGARLGAAAAAVGAPAVDYADPAAARAVLRGLLQAQGYTDGPRPPGRIADRVRRLVGAGRVATRR